MAALTHPGDRLQTIERPSPTINKRGTPPWGPAALVAAGVLSIPVVLLAIFNKWGVLVLVALAMIVGLGIWIWYRGFVLLEVIAFLIHFDGIGAGPISMGRIVAGLVAILLVYKLAVERWRPPAVPFRSWAPAWVLLTWAVLSGAWSGDSGMWFQTLGVLGLALVYFCITSMLIDSHKSIHQFLRAYWVGGLFGSVAGIVALVLGTRSVGFGADPNFFGLLEASMIPLTVYYRRHAIDARSRWIYTFALILVLGGAAGAGSRSGLIGASIAIVATMVTRPGIDGVKRTKIAALAMLVAPLAFLVGFIANPNNLERGFSDRGAGRLDFWTVTVELIRENPIVGYGLGQVQTKIPDRILVTPGSQRLNDKRDAVSSHNTWLDVTGDLGVVGLVIFVSVFGVVVVGLLRPRWPHMKEVSTTVFVMLLPVYSSSMFLPLLNNKLSWAIIGMAAALQTPSVDSRWSGLAGERPRDTNRPKALPRVGGASMVPAVVASSHVEVSKWVPYSDPFGGVEMPDVKLARWDLKLPSTIIRMVVAGAVAAGLVAFLIGSSLDDQYSATTAIMAPSLDTSQSPEYIKIDEIHMQGVLTLPVSGAYAAELKRLSGIDLSVDEIRERMTSNRPKMGALIQFGFTDSNAATVNAVQPYLITALNNIYADARSDAAPQTANEARPTVPGEQRFYTGPGFLPVYSDAVLAVTTPKVLWMTFTASIAGALTVVGVALAKGRKARVLHTDDLFGFTGVEVWTTIGGGAQRRKRSTTAQLEQLALCASGGLGGHRASRIVVAPPRFDAASRRLAMDLAAALVRQGRRVVLIDAQIDRPLLSFRLGSITAAGVSKSADEVEGGVPNLRTISIKRLPVEARELVGDQIDRLRFVGGGRLLRNSSQVIDVAALDRIDESVTVVVLAPATAGRVAVSELLAWSDSVVVPLRSGITSTAEAEDATANARMFAHGAKGIVVANA